MWKRGCILAVAVFGLGGCKVGTDGMVSHFTNFITAPYATSQGIYTLSLLGGAANVRGPDGYCVDQTASNARSGFAVLVGCALLSGSAGVMPKLDGLITVQFGAENTASVTNNENVFVEFLKTDAGLGLLVGSGDLAHVSQVSTITNRAGVLVRFQDTSSPTFAGTVGPQWRGFLDINGRLVTISVLSFERVTLSRAEGERLLVMAMAELAEANVEIAVAEASSKDNG
ncbi:MAG: hypothetical protein ACI901_001395 [Octadecabacter sp.]|jgi:hypothetical protein